MKNHEQSINVNITLRINNEYKLGFFLSRSSLLKGLSNVGNKVLSILNTNTQSDEVVKDTGGLTLVLGDTSVGHGSRNLAERLNTTQGLSQSEDLGAGAELGSSLGATLDSE